MSIIFYVFFLCLSMHTCNARHPGVMDANPSHKKLPFSTEVFGSVKLNKGDDLNALQQQSTRDDINFRESNELVKPKESDDSLHKEVKQNREISPVPAPIEPFASVSGRLPRKNLDERTGFFSDYSRPRTRPPSHN